MLGDYLMPCAMGFLAGGAFSIFYNVRSPGRILILGAGGALGWLVYLLASPLGSDLFQYFWAGVAISVYAEVMARVCKAPATGFLQVAFLPLVPGGGIYRTMEYCLYGQTELFVETGLHTLGIAGCLAMGVLLVSSLVRMWAVFRRGRRNGFEKI